MDDAARRTLRPYLVCAARRADAAGLRPVHFTVLGLGLALSGAAGAGLGWWWAALVLWLLSRVPDGLDGVLARLQGDATDVGGFLDVMADFSAYGAFVVGVAIGSPQARVACAALLLAYYLNGSAFLAISGLAHKRGHNIVDEERSFQFVAGLTEGTESIIAHAFFALVAAVQPTWVAGAVWVFAALVGVTVVQRVMFGWRLLQP